MLLKSLYIGIMNKLFKILVLLSLPEILFIKSGISIETIKNLLLWCTL